MKALLFDCGTRDPLASWGLLLLRAATGAMMAIGHGWPKLAAYSKLKDDWHVPGFLGFLSPPLSLVLTIGAEFGAALLIVVGLATRPAAFGLAVTMTVAAFEVHGRSAWFLSPTVTAAKEPALMYLIAALVLLVTGAGAKSLDAAIFKPKRRRLYA